MTTPVQNPLHHGDIAWIEFGRFTGHVAIVSMRRIARGRRAGQCAFVVASLEPGGFGGNTYAVNLTGTSRLTIAKRSFPDATVADAIARVHNTRMRIDGEKEAIAEKGRDAMGDPDWNTNYRSGLRVTDKMAVGDTVTIKYRGGERVDERLVGINPRTGKIAIASPRNRSGKRWLLATQVVEVRNAAGVKATVTL